MKKQLIIGAIVILIAGWCLFANFIYFPIELASATSDNGYTARLLLEPNHEPHSLILTPLLQLSYNIYAHVDVSKNDQLVRRIDLHRHGDYISHFDDIEFQWSTDVLVLTGGGYDEPLRYNITETTKTD